MIAVSEWAEAPAELRLGEEEIHVWRAPLVVGDAMLRLLGESLSPAERERAGRFVFPRDRDAFIAARGVLRAILGKYLRRSASEIDFDYQPEGRPMLRHAGELPMRFNVSHSNGLALYAFALRSEVGVDVEAIRLDAACEEIAEHCFSAAELAELRSLPQRLRPEGFLLGWTRKEAYVKARGSGLGIPLDSFDVTLTPGRREELRSVDSARWTLRSLRPGDGYVGAVVGEGKDWALRLWDYRAAPTRCSG